MGADTPPRYARTGRDRHARTGPRAPAASSPRLPFTVETAPLLAPGTGICAPVTGAGRLGALPVKFYQKTKCFNLKLNNTLTKSFFIGDVSIFTIIGQVSLVAAGGTAMTVTGEAELRLSK